MTTQQTDARPTIGMLVSIVDPHQPFWAGALDAAQAHDVHTVCFAGGVLPPPDDSPIESASLAEVPAAAFYDIIDVDDLDGLITWAGSGAGLGEHLNDEEMAQFISRYRTLPLVNYEGTIDDIPNVSTDTYPGMCELLNHLIDVHGRRRIALIRGPFGHKESEDRVRAYMDTLARHDIPIDPALICPPGGWGLGYGRPAVGHLIDKRGLRPGSDFDAIAATEIGYALGCIPALRERGINVPNDVAVVGFNDHHSALEVDPPITTMQKPFYTSGYRAMEAVLDLSQGRDVPPQIEVPTQPKWRASCGCEMVDAAALPDQEIGGPRLHQQTVNYASVLFSISDDLMQTRTTAALAGVLAQRLPEVGIRGCYLALYDEPEPFGMRTTAPQWSSLVLSFQHGGLTAPTSAPRRIRTRALVREILAQEEEASAWMAVPLHFSHQQFGIVVFEVGLRVGLFYHRLAHEISDALHAILVLPDYERTQRSLRESEARMRTLIEHMPVEFWAKTPDGTYFMQNSVMRELVGDNAGLTLQEIQIDEALRAQWRDEDERVLDGETVTSEHTMRRDGDERTYQQIVAPVMVDGEVVAVQGLMFDITDQKRLEASLRKAQAESEAARRAAEEASRAKSRFLAHMSHELRTPLNSVLGFSDIMAQDPDLPNRLRENLATIRRSSTHLLALINDVLDISKIEAGKMVLQPTTFDLHDMLRGLDEMFGLRAAEKALTMTFNVGARVPRKITADENKLRQVLINLLGNAVKFTHHGSIQVDVTQPARDVTPAPQTGPDEGPVQTARLHIAVRDTGVGIAPEELDAAFETFDQTASGRRTGQGTGLGLPISREFVRLMGGEMEMESAVGVGTCFSFDLPVVVHSAPRSDAPDAPAGPPDGEEPVDPATSGVRSLADLAPAWVTAMRKAATVGDILQIEHLIEQIRTTHPRLAGRLTQLTAGYAHDAILTLLQEVPHYDDR